MAPIRRYVRISPHSLLEVRIFLENPADTTRWLLSRDSPALPRVFEAVRPLILPKLREERERTATTKGKGKKGKSVKDVVEGEGFRVVVFLTEGATRHEVVVKKRTAKEGKTQGWKMGRGDTVVIPEEDEDGDLALGDVPEADDDGVEEVGSRRRADGDDNDDESFGGWQDDKKKLGFDTRYEGFSIWGKVLCLLVERTGGKLKATAAAAETDGAQKVMQEWISSTQVGVEEDEG